MPSIKNKAPDGGALFLFFCFHILLLNRSGTPFGYFLLSVETSSKGLAGC